jgi:hypothetical protein
MKKNIAQNKKIIINGKNKLKKRSLSCVISYKNIIEDKVDKYLFKKRVENSHKQ